MPHFATPPDVVIAGAGIIGLSLALELQARGARVTVLERGTALAQASTAAAGMLAAEDPHMLDALRPLARLSLSLYPAYLAQIAALSGMAVPLQTETTVQYLEQGGPVRLAEHSLDPRQLAAALLAAVRGTSVELREGAGEIELEKLRADYVVHANGAWFRNVVSRLGDVTPGGIVPVKGQMLRVRLPPELRDLQEVHRSEEVYIVPRTCGPQAGTALIGATVEAAGFDTTTHAADLAELRAKAAMLMPALGEENAAPQLEAWAGLRPAAADRLPVIGGSGGQFIATGHFRDGILLAPATAVVLADLIEGTTPSIALAAFSPSRFAEQPAHPLR